MNKLKRAIICGHTGATSMKVLDELVSADWTSEIITIGRRNYPKYENNPKVKQIIEEDLNDLFGVDMKEIAEIRKETIA